MTRRAYMDPSLREHFVYRSYDSAGRLLYIGCTRNIDSRWNDHRYGSAWAEFAVGFRLAGPFNYDTARRLEAEAIASEEPLFNFKRGDLRERRLRQAAVERHMAELAAARPKDPWWTYLYEAIERADLEVPPPLSERDKYLLLIGGAA